MILLAARNLGITRIVLLLDCMEVVRMAKLEYLPPGAPTIMMYLREILSYDWCIEIHHIDRKRNRLAHDLAKLADESSLCPIYFPHPLKPDTRTKLCHGLVKAGKQEEILKTRSLLTRVPPLNLMNFCFALHFSVLTLPLNMNQDASGR
ncbi:hypothetical protein V6N11_070504 [Hibiscus sabdariffa]|uniref:RNase H type-1 domain-containing protein n=1 Tax=Hibiscus sabdariffa TaxID=183260 RepID=A0ABR2QFM5_9ROSI